MYVELAVVLLLFFTSYHWSKPRKTHGLPRIGPPTIFGYLWTAVRYTLNHPAVVTEGREKFKCGPFVLPTLGGSMIVVGPENVEFLQGGNDTVFSQPAAIDETLTLHQTMDEHQMATPYQATVVRTDLSRAIPLLIPEVYDEMNLTMDEIFAPSEGSDSVVIPVFDTVTHMIGRITNRALVGAPLCRDPKYVHAMVHFAESVVLYSCFLRWFPTGIRDTMYFILTSLFGGKAEALNFLVPFLTAHIQDRVDMEDRPNTLAEFLVRAAPPNEIADPSRIAMRLMNMNFGSIHTSSIFTSQSLFELAAMSNAQRDEVRDEVRQALASEGGWTKAALAKFRKLDSLLREVGRVYGLSGLGMNRMTIQDGTLPDGTFVPAGYIVTVDLLRAHMNPEVYPDPEVFDPFRFSKLRELAGGDAKNGFTTVDKNFLPFGVGRHACAGRHFAAMQLKMMLAYILLNYDFSFQDGIKTRPKNVTFDAGLIPDPKAKLVFKKREDAERIY